MSAPLILAANTVVADDLRVGNALNFMGASNTSSRFQRTNASNGSSTQATLSAWVKYQTEVSQSVPIFMAPASSGSSRFYINITSSEEMGGTFNAPDCDFSTTNDEKLRDPAAWYHIVAAINTSDSTAADRLKIYVNNERITLTFATGGGLGSGANIHFNTSGYKNIFGYNNVSNDGIGNLTDMYFSEVIKCDGQVLTPSSFAEYDDDGIWVPKTGLEDSLTFGTTGYYFNFADSSDLGNDVSGNNNDASDVSNTTQSLDTPSNSFAVLNPLVKGNASITLSEGNLKAVFPGSWTAIPATYGLTKGKWYFEAKNETSGSNAFIGVVTENQNWGSSTPYSETTGVVLYGPGGRKTVDGTDTDGFFATLSSGQIVGVALDLDSSTKTIQFSVNGTDTPNSTPVDLPSTFDNVFIFPYFIGNSSSATANWQVNFGNPQFSISSGNSDGNGYGNFEYAVPSGFYSINTKNIAEFG